MNYKEFYSSMYENVYIDITNNDIAKINGINENLDLIHLKYCIISINFEGISILEKDTYEKLLSFEFSDIVRIYLKNENIIKINVYNENKKYPIELKINMIFNYKDDMSESSSKNTNEKNNKRILNYNEFDAYFLYEDIISYIQFNLLTNTQTKIVENIEDFDFIYMKRNKLQDFSDIKRINEIDINRFKMVKKNSDIYKIYKSKKEEKIKENESEIEEIKEKEKEKEESKSKIKSISHISHKDILSDILKINPQVAMMKELREKEAKEYEKKPKRANRSLLSSCSNITANNENEDDFFSDVKVTGFNANIEKDKIKKKEEKMEKIKKKTFDIEELLIEDNKTEDIMKEIEEEQKKWEEKINSSASSFNITSSMNEINNNNKEYKINIFEFNNMDDKTKKHIIKEKKLENKIEKAQRLLKDKDLMSPKTREKLKKESGNSNGSDKSMSESSYLSYLSKIQRYPF